METVNQSLTEKQNKKSKFDVVITIVLFVVLILMTTLIILNKFVFLSVYVEGGSMSPTLSSGDVLFVNPSQDVEVGDIIVIKGEKTDDSWIIKRVIAIGKKDKTVIVEIKDGKVYVGDDGQTYPILEPYLPEGRQTNVAQGNQNRWELGENDIFYLGDNRPNSRDSRDNGCCEKNQVVGVVGDWALKMRWLSGFMFSVGEFFGGIFKGE